MKIKNETRYRTVAIRGMIANAMAHAHKVLRSKTVEGRRRAEFEEQFKASPTKDELVEQLLEAARQRDDRIAVQFNQCARVEIYYTRKLTHERPGTFEHRAYGGTASSTRMRIRVPREAMDLRQFMWVATWLAFIVFGEEVPEAYRERRLYGLDDTFKRVFDRYVTERHALNGVPDALLMREVERDTFKATLRAMKTDPTLEKLASIEAAEKRWTTKLRRAETALAKLKRRRRYYEKRLEKRAGS